MLSGTNNINSRANRTRDYCVNTALMFKISDVGYVAVAAKDSSAQCINYYFSIDRLYHEELILISIMIDYHINLIRLVTQSIQL